MDDDQMVRTAAARMLRSNGQDVAVAADGEEAIRLYREAIASHNGFDVVVLDLTVAGGMGGRECMEHLVRIDPNIKAIVSSGYSDDPIMSEFREYGFSDVVAKPYSLTELAEIVARLV